MLFKSFEELQVYKVARQFRNSIYGLIRELPEEEKYNLVSQMRRAATSLTNNIAEGYCRFHYQENIQFCRQTRGSLSELVDDLNISLDQEYFPEEQLKPLRELALEVNKQLNGYAAHRKRRKEET